MYSKYLIRGREGLIKKATTCMNKYIRRFFYQYDKVQDLKMMSICLPIIILMTGCSIFGPKYTKPDVKPPQDWNSGKSNTQESGSLMSDTAWWKQFNDPDLNNMIETALKNNNQIQVAIGNISQAAAQLHKVQMSWVPTTNLGGGGYTGQSFNQSITPTNPALSQYTTSNQMNFNGSFIGFMPSYTINIFQTLKNQEAAGLNLKMQQASKNAVRLSVITQVTGAYFSLLSLHKQLELQQQMVTDAMESKKYTLLQVKVGSASEINVREIDQLINNLSAQIPSIEHNITQTENALQVLMNKNPAKIINKNNIDNIKTSGIIPVGLPSSVLQNRPDIMAAEYTVAISNAKIGVATTAFFPIISLVSPVGSSSFALSNILTGGADFWMAQAVAAMPLLNLGLYDDIKQAKGNYYSTYYNYIQTVRDAFAQVDNGLSQYQTSNNAYTQQEKSCQAADDLYKLIQIQYNNGMSSYASTINYKLNADYAKSNLNQAKMNQLNSIVNLYQVLAGGYNINNTESAVKFGDDHDI